MTNEVISAPPPPPEVKVRTMRSDLEAMAKSGGGLPQFRSVKVVGLWSGENVTVAERMIPKKGIVVALVAIAAVVVIIVLGYFIYHAFFAGTAASQSTSTTASEQNQQTQHATSSIAATAPFIHASLFKKPADQALTLMLSLGSAASSAADLVTFNQKLSVLLAGASTSTNIIEINMQTTDRHGVAIGDLLAKANASILSAQALTHFNPDETFFVYRNKDGFWPGIVLLIRPGDNWLFAEGDVAKLESSPDIANLFLGGVGAPSGNGFADGTVSSTAARILSFPSVNPPASFVYGWYENYLIISTSQDGFAVAMSQLS